MGIAKSTPCGFENPDQAQMKFEIYNYVADMTTCKSTRHCDNVGGLGEYVSGHFLVF